jgi:predicted restriction endonuclease
VRNPNTGLSHFLYGNQLLDPDNGLLLCIVHDALFDRGYISFEDNGNILLSYRVDEALQRTFNVDSQMSIKLSGSQKKYIAFHRERRFIK